MDYVIQKIISIGAHTILLLIAYFIVDLVKLIFLTFHYVIKNETKTSRCK